jgi:hypothetical protein
MSKGSAATMALEARGWGLSRTDRQGCEYEALPTSGTCTRTAVVQHDLASGTNRICQRGKARAHLTQLFDRQVEHLTRPLLVDIAQRDGDISRQV